MNLKDRFANANCEDVQAKRVLEFLIPILYPEKPTWVTVTIGNTIFGALLDERKVDWGIILQSVIAKLVKNAWKQKATPIGSYVFNLYNGQEVLLQGEIVAYNIGLDLLKYECILDPDPDQYTSPRSDPQSSPPTQRSNRKPSNSARSSQSQDF